MSALNEQLIKDRNSRLTIFGSGYVGLLTAAIFADAGFCVTAKDVKPEVVDAVNIGISPINEPGLQELISRNVRARRLRATLSSIEATKQTDAIIISVQTPIDQKKKPNLSFLMGVLEEVGKTMKKGMLVIISSTVPPGTLRGKVESKLESLSRLKADTDFYLAYVPERISPGKALKEFVESPRLIGGIGPNSTKMAAELFKTVCKKVIETDVTTAEVAKLSENTFRDVNIAFANQIALICEKLGVDILEVIKLANTHPRVNIHTPGPGVGGPCLPKDPYLLTHKTELTEQNIITTARQINDHMPKHIVRLILQALRNTRKDIEKSKIAILGTAYKSDVDDSRLSPSEPIIHELIQLGAETIVYDPHCAESFGAKRAKSLHEAIKDADCLTIITDHKEFKNLNLKEIKALMNEMPAVVDGRRIINPKDADDFGFTYYGVGFRVHAENSCQKTSKALPILSNEDPS
jgi:UDP-N-acetyl-D-mannosaminuronic acid dehydrogenase